MGFNSGFKGLILYLTYILENLAENIYKEHDPEKILWPVLFSEDIMASAIQ